LPVLVILHLWLNIFIVIILVFSTVSSDEFAIKIHNKKE